MSKLNIKVKSFDHAQADLAAKKIVEVALKNKAKVSGPVPLPTKREVVTILRSVHVNKKSREQFESRTYQRLIVVSEFDDKAFDQIKRLELPSGISVKITQK